MNALAARRRHPAAVALLLLLGLLATGTAYTLLAPKPAEAATSATSDQIEEGRKLFLANCASCHGTNAQGKATGDGNNIAGPSLAGVGAASVDFQMGTGRMPMAGPSVQAPKGTKLRFNQEEIDKIAAYIASLSPGPAVPSAADVDYASANPARGGEIFRVNCAMCHNFAGAGGALTRGKYAPALKGVTPTHIYEAMETGPQNMPVFSDTNLDPQAKRDVIAYLKALEEEPAQGGSKLGSIGPVSEGLVAWIFGLGMMIAASIWLAKKAA